MTFNFSKTVQHTSVGQKSSVISFFIKIIIFHKNIILHEKLCLHYPENIFEICDVKHFILFTYPMKKVCWSHYNLDILLEASLHSQSDLLNYYQGPVHG